MSRLYIIAFTSGLSGAGSQSDFSVRIQLNKDVQTVLLYNRPGDDYRENKGDLWDIPFSSFGFSERCISISDIERMSIVGNEHDDDWSIETIVTLVGDSLDNYQLLTHDFDVNRWLIGDSNGHFVLNFHGKLSNACIIIIIAIYANELKYCMTKKFKHISI